MQKESKENTDRRKLKKEDMGNWKVQDNKRSKFVSFYTSIIARSYNGKKENDLIVMDPKNDKYPK